MHGKKYPAKNSHPQSWGPWSDWKWNQDHGRYYRERFDRQGRADYKWANEGVTTDDQRTPRTEATIDQLTADLGGLDVNSSGYNYNQDSAYGEQDDSPVNHSTSDIPASPLYRHDNYYDENHGYAPSHSHSHKDKGKAKSNSAPKEIPYGERRSQYGSVPSTRSPYGQYDYPEHSGSVLRQNDYGRAASNSYYTQPTDQDATDYELEQALKISRDEHFGSGHVGGSSASGSSYDSGSIYPGTYDLDPAGPGEIEITPRGTPLPTRSDYMDTPSSNYADNTIIRGTPGSVEQIDNRFVVESSYKFQPGEVFKILWSEPTGQVVADAPISDVRAINDSRGQFYIGYRRFIIVTTDESHHSTCVPILTYDRRGCGKKGVRPNKHGIIYAVGQAPRLLKNEPELGFDAVPLEIYAEGETLAKESRVNYSKLVTIEHNVKVFFIGRVPYPYFDLVSYAVDKCWNDKMHKANKKSRR